MPWGARGFQLTAARRRLELELGSDFDHKAVSTHSRPKAAGKLKVNCLTFPSVSTHSRPKAAGVLDYLTADNMGVSTHSRPKAAGGLFAQWVAQ